MEPIHKAWRAQRVVLVPRSVLTGTLSINARSEIGSLEYIMTDSSVEVLAGLVTYRQLRPIMRQDPCPRQRSLCGDIG